jgi:hypothetical protein
MIHSDVMGYIEGEPSLVEKSGWIFLFLTKLRLVSRKTKGRGGAE